MKYLNEGGDIAYDLDEMDLIDRLTTFEAFLQPNQPFQTFVPKLCLRGFFDEVMRGRPPKKAYKGVSYNPRLRIDGEKLDNMDFFAWAKNVQKKVPDFSLTVLDASPYEVINQIPDAKFPKGLKDSEMAEWFYGKIEEGVERDPELQENCRLRGLYLRALMGVSEVNGQVVSALDLIRSRDPELLRSFQDARKLCGMTVSEDGKLNVDRFVTYRRYGQEFAKTYTPAVVAEALYFMRRNGITAKLGPCSEMAFDKIIADCMRSDGGYDFFWYSRPFEKSGNTRNRIYTGDQADTVRKKLTSDPSYANWVNAVLEPFSYEEAVVDRVVDINSRILKLVQ